jgi:hypothetical protein
MGAHAQIVARMADDRAQLIEWLQGLSRSTGMTLSAIAREAEVSTTTVTRYVNDPSYKFDLARRTIRKIEERFGSRAPVSSGMGDQVRTGFETRPSREPAEPKAPLTVIVSDDALDLRGIRKGDVCNLDPALEARPGDLVLAELQNSLHRRERIVRIFSPPYLLAHSTSGELNRPLLIEPGRVRVLGPLVKLTRELNSSR